jgi:hypothetical protein
VKTSRDFLELLEPDRQSVSVRTIVKPSRPVDQCPGDSLKPNFEERAIMDFEQPTPIRRASKAAWWIFVNGKPFETIGYPNCSSASMTMWAASGNRGSGRCEIAHRPP